MGKRSESSQEKKSLLSDAGNQNGTYYTVIGSTGEAKETKVSGRYYNQDSVSELQNPYTLLPKKKKTLKERADDLAQRVKHRCNIL